MRGPDHKITLVTGAARGVGEALAEGFVRDGGRVNATGVPGRIGSAIAVGAHCIATA